LRADKALYRTGHTVLRYVERIVGETDPLADVRCCHNDVVAANIVGRDPPMLLDWEYASDNDPLFDLASVIAYHCLDDRAADLLLRAYTGDATKELFEQLVIQRRLNDALHWLWLAVRESLSPAAEQTRRLTALRDRLRSG
jgi:thiamine kinase-like enzyme